MTVVRITDIFTGDGIRGARDRLYVVWADGTVQEFGSVEQGRDYAVSMDADVDITKRMALALGFAKDSTARNATLFRKQVTFDLTAVDPIKTTN